MNIDRVRERIKVLFAPEFIQAAEEAEEKAACKTCSKLVLCGKVFCDNITCELKERRND